MICKQLEKIPNWFKIKIFYSLTPWSENICGWRELWKFKIKSVISLLWDFRRKTNHCIPKREI